jgi:antitoxin component YwqK of YwqJK toxin-antitoxin module
MTINKTNIEANNMKNNKIGKLAQNETIMLRYYRCLIFLFCILPATEAFAQTTDTLKRRDGEGRYFIQVRSYGLVTDEGYLLNNLPEGVWITYWHTNLPREIITCKQGKKNGTKISMTPTGNIELLENYKNDKLDGPHRVYNGEGRIVEEALYSEGKKHGPYTKWYPNGKKSEESNFVYDRRDGKGIWYFENGTKAAEYSYRDDAIDGDAVTYFNNGTVSAYGLYEKGKQTGLWKEYYENGNLKAEGKYVKGEKEGAWQEYDAAGKNPKTINYKKGERK